MHTPAGQAPDEAWHDALDALEEWVRRSAAALSQPAASELGPGPQLPQGTAPDSVRLRAQLVLASLGEVMAQAHRQRAQLTRQQAYGAA